MPLNRYSWGKALSTMIRTNKNIIYFYIKEMPFLDLKILVSSPAPAQPLVSKWTRMKKTAHHQTLQPMFSMTQIINGPIPKLWVLTPNIQRCHDFTNGKRKMERSRKISPISFSHILFQNTIITPYSCALHRSFNTHTTYHSKSPLFH